jgi:hypothetical protein
MGAICRPHETLELARCQICNLMLVKPEGTATAVWQTVVEFGCRQVPPSPNSLI